MRISALLLCPIVGTADWRWDRSDPADRSRINWGGWLLILLVVLGCLSRVVYLDADPLYYAWEGYAIDEGRWTGYARALAQRSSSVEPPHALHLLLAPLYQALTYLSFVVFGVSHLSARVVPASFGCVLLVLLWALLHRRVSQLALGVALALILFHADYVMLSRVSVPEMPVMATSLAAFAVLVSNQPRRLRLSFAGVLLAITATLKATSLSFFGIFAVVAWFDRRPDEAPSPISNIAWLLGPGAVASALLLVSTLSTWWPARDGLVQQIEVLQRFVGLRSAYAAISLLFSGPSAPVFNFAGLGVWIALLGFLANRPAPEDPRWRLARGAGIWALLYFALVLLQRYFPDRYIVHVLTPLAIFTAAGIDLLLQSGLGGLSSALAPDRGVRALPAVMLLSFPTAVLLAPVLAGVATEAYTELRLRECLAALAAAFGLCSALLWFLRDREMVVEVALMLPGVGALLWFAGWAFLDTPFAFWPARGGAPAATWMATWRILASAFFSMILVAGLRGREPIRMYCAIIGIGSSAIWALHLAPTFIHPHYTLRDVSRDLGERFGSSAISHAHADGLFLDTEIHATPLVRTWQSDPPEFLVTLFRFRPFRDNDVRFLEERYEPIAHHDLFLSPRFLTLRRHSWPEYCCSPDGHHVSVYRRRDPPSIAPHEQQPD